MLPQRALSPLPRCANGVALREPATSLKTHWIERTGEHMVRKQLRRVEASDTTAFSRDARSVSHLIRWTRVAERSNTRVAA
jgi:hypothetical protein